MSSSELDGSSLGRTLGQLYVAEGGPGLGSPGHVMYSDEPPMVEGMNDEDFFAFAFSQGKGVMVHSQPLKRF
jgi:hypothetical protein